MRWLQLIIFIGGLLFGSTTMAQQPPPMAVHPLREGVVWRLGLMNSGLFESAQGRPFFYFDTGFRFKTDDVYLDVKLPALIGAMDFVSYNLQDAFGLSSPFNFFEAMNSPIQYGAYLEIAHIRLGQTFTLDPLGTGDKLRLTLGGMFSAEFVFFDLVRFQNFDAEDFNPTEGGQFQDPVVISPGAFFALGGDAPSSNYDIAIGAGPDVYNDSSFEPNSGLTIYADLDLQIDLTQDVGAYFRSRVSTYTHSDTFVVTLAVAYGVTLRVW